MRNSLRVAEAAAVLAATSNAASLADVCTVSNVQAAIPSNGTLLGINLTPSSVTANSVYNATSTGSTTAYSYCNVTATYSHPGKNDEVVIWYTFPSPDSFKNRFYVGGGGGYSLNASPTGGLAYGAVAGVTSAGYDALSGTSYDDVVLLGNGTINWDATYMFGYQALGEMTLVGKYLTEGFYSLDANTKIYTYYEGCSDGGREGWSQIQRWGEEYDGVITGAPALRYAQQQVNHVFSNVVEKTLDYYPPPCEMDKIVNLTIAACDPLDGRTDGVVSRTDLCKLNFNLNTTIGEPYYCAAENSTSLGFGFGQKRKRQIGGSSSSYQPEQSGNVSARGVAVAQTILEGLIDSKGQRGYLSWQPACSFQDATTQYDSTTDSWELDIASTGGEFIEKYVELQDADNLSSLDNVTYDTMVDWMNTAMFRYMDSLQTTYPDLSIFQSNGGKILHYHGESDDSIPTSSSVHWHNSVRSTMYPNLSYNESVSALGDWYRLFLVPGAAHCSTNTLQPGPYPEDNMATIIDWVENGVEPIRLNATVSSGSYAGETQELCAWPLRPYWANNGTSLECEYDQASIDTWNYTFNAFKFPVY